MLVSVIIPAYNAGATIESCLQALVPQANGLAQVIVVDDGSTDDTAARVAGCRGVTLLRAPHLGPAAARNLGARTAPGDILLFTDADCQPAANWMERMLAPFMGSGDPAAGAKGVYRTRQREWVARFVQLEYEEKYARMSKLQAIDFIDTYSAAYRRDIFLANGGFDETFPNASVEDQELSFRLAAQGLALVFVPDAVVYHRHVTSIAAYCKRKFKIGHWKVHLHRRHPDKLWGDSHTPPTVRIQVVLLALLLAALALSPFVPFALAAAFALAVCFGLTALPLLIFVLRRDRGLAPAALVLIVLRAAALGAGILAGVLGEVGRVMAVKRYLWGL